jgi:hypothetical protein
MKININIERQPKVCYTESGCFIEINGLKDLYSYISKMLGRRLRKEEFTYVKRELYKNYPACRPDHPAYNGWMSINPDWIARIIKNLIQMNEEYNMAIAEAIDRIYYFEEDTGHVSFKNPYKNQSR